MTTDYDKFVKEHLLVQHDPMFLVAGLFEEVGEVAQLVRKKRRGTPISRVDYLAELGDVLYYVVALLNHHGFTLEECLAFNVSKLEIKHK